MTLDHNSPEYKKTVQTLSELEAAVVGSNSYAESDLEDQQTRLKEIAAIIVVLEAPRAEVTRVQAMACGVLTYLAAKFADEPIGALAKAAWEALQILIAS